MTRRAAEVARRFDACKARYADVDRAANASSPGQLLDNIIQHRRRSEPDRSISYKEVMTSVLSLDPDLAELYGL